MVWCAVLGCFSSSNTGGVAFFKFPQEKKLVQLWTAQISRKDFNPSQQVDPRVCEKHFEKEAFDVNYDISKQIGRKLILKKDAVPTLHLGRRTKDEVGDQQRRRTSLAFQKRQNLQLLGLLPRKWTDKNDEKLASEVASCPWLYDATHNNYKDVNIRQKTWKEIGQNLKLSGIECKKRWTYLRDKYIRYRRVHMKALTTGSTAETLPTIKWNLYPLMNSFLFKTGQHRTVDNKVQFGSSSQTPDSAIFVTSSSSSPTASDVESIEIKHLKEEDEFPVAEVLSSSPSNLEMPVKRKAKDTSTPSPSRKRTKVDKSWQKEFLELFKRKVKTVKTPAELAGEYTTSVLQSVKDATLQSKITLRLMNSLHEIMLQETT